MQLRRTDFVYLSRSAAQLYNANDDSLMRKALMTLQVRKPDLRKRATVHHEAAAAHLALQDVNIDLRNGP